MTLVARVLLPLFASIQSPTLATFPAGTPSGTAELTAGGLVWSHFVDLAFPQVALGDRGGQVLALHPTGLRELVLLSSFDANPPAPIWVVPDSPMWTHIAAASEADVYLFTDVRARNFTSVGTLKKYTSRSSDCAWKFDFTPQLWSQPLSDVSRDGQTIVSAFLVDFTLTVEVRVHDPATGAALQTFMLPSGGNPQRFDLSPDGKVAVLVSSVGLAQSFVVLDLATQSVLLSADGSTPFQQALSDEGRVLVFFDETNATANHLRVFARGPTGYAEVLDVPTPPEVWPRDAAVSEDGSTVVAAWGRSGTPHETIVRAYDVATGAMTMERVQGAGAAIFPSDVAISADGSRFAVGLSSAGSAAHAELAIYRRDSNQPLAEHPVGGSVYEVEIAPDGQRVAVTRIPTNRGTYTSSVELYEVGGEDFVVRGRPSVGATVTFELHGAAGARAMLLRSFALAPNPIDVPGVGRLHLDPVSLASEPMGTVPPSGPAVLAVTLDHLPGMIGRTLFYQGFTTQPRSLTRDLVQLTIVP